ncbi:MAG: hypothetical protein ACLR9W_05795 [Enterobacter hormaechei]
MPVAHSRHGPDVAALNRATELALEQAGLIDNAVLTNGQTASPTARH